MSTTKTKRPLQAPRRPEKKIGPFHNGLGIAIWLNRVETDQGPRFFRSITLAPRRYLEEKTGQWKDASSFRPVDLATLELALANAQKEAPWEDHLHGIGRFAHNRYVRSFEPGAMDSQTQTNHTRR